jgi:hypothetical protein
MLRRYARTRGTAAKKKEPLTIERLPAVLLAMTKEGPAAARDRALLLLGYAGAGVLGSPLTAESKGRSSNLTKVKASEPCGKAVRWRGGRSCIDAQTKRARERGLSWPRS